MYMLMYCKYYWLIFPSYMSLHHLLFYFVPRCKPTCTENKLDMLELAEAKILYILHICNCLFEIIHYLFVTFVLDPS